MALLIIMLLMSLAFILVSCAYFTNAVEWLGKKLNLNQGVIGSIFAAVGTAMPETIIPVIAIIFHNGQSSEEIGVGAIVGAPFMLSTLGFFVTGASAVIYALFRKRSLKITPSLTGFQRDMSYFIIIYSLAVITSIVNNYIDIKSVVSIAILVSYFVYVIHTFSSNDESINDVKNLYFSSHFHSKPTVHLILLQLIFSLLGISYGAHIFIKYTEQVSAMAGIPPAILSLIITPIATELPEKLNSVLWVGQKKRYPCPFKHNRGNGISIICACCHRHDVYRMAFDRTYYAYNHVVTYIIVYMPFICIQQKKFKPICFDVRHHFLCNLFNGTALTILLCMMRQFHQSKTYGNLDTTFYQYQHPDFPLSYHVCIRPYIHSGVNTRLL